MVPVPVIGRVSIVSIIVLSCAHASNDLILANDNQRLVLTSAAGLRHFSTGTWTALDVPANSREAVGWRMLIPISGSTPPNQQVPRRRFNYAYSTEQKAPPVVTAHNDSRATFQYDHVWTQNAGQVNISLTLTVELRGDSTLWSAAIANGSPYVVENVYWPYWGEMVPPAGAQDFQQMQYGYASPTVFPLYPTFGNTQGYFGDDYSEQLGKDFTAGTPSAAYALFHTPGQRNVSSGELMGGARGLYWGVEDDSGDRLFDNSGLVTWVSELRPGYQDSMSQAVQHGAHTRVAAVHLPYILPGSVRKLTPISIQPFEGDWTAGVDVYKKWLKSWLHMPELPEWTSHPHSWQQVQLNDPEDKQGVNYTQFVEVTIQ